MKFLRKRKLSRIKAFQKFREDKSFQIFRQDLISPSEN